jgi:hypothetical protein
MTALLMVMPIMASEVMVKRMLPSSVVSGGEFEVSIEVSGCGAFGQVIETLPQGFTYLSCNWSDIEVEQVGNQIKFTFLGDAASFSYRVRAPIVEGATNYTFQGVVLDENRAFYFIDDSTITVICCSDDAPVAAGLSSIYSCVELVYGYYPGEGERGWTIFRPEWVNAHPEWNSLSDLHKGRGYWIKVNRDCQLVYGSHNTADNPVPAYNLHQGWNLIGWLGC